MKVEIIKTEQQQEITYPCLMTCKEQYVVLFSGERTGLVISNNNYHPLGYRSDSWHMDCFYPFSGKVVLSNE